MSADLINLAFFKSSCKNKHIEEICEKKTCDKKICNKRHPKPCKYFVNFGDCKLGSSCAYAHNSMKMEIEKLEQKVDGLTLIIKEKEDIINQLIKDVKDMKSIVDRIHFEDEDDDDTNDEDNSLDEENEVYDEKTADLKAKEES